MYIFYATVVGNFIEHLVVEEALGHGVPGDDLGVAASASAWVSSR